jgi:hypothetical protein
MGQSSNSGRNATLDEKKSRAAGRRNTKSPEREAIRDWQRPVAMKGKTGGAKGRDDVANKTQGRSGFTRGGGGGGGASSPAKANNLTVGRSRKPAKKRAG